MCSQCVVLQLLGVPACKSAFYTLVRFYLLVKFNMESDFFLRLGSEIAVVTEFVHVVGFHVNL